MARVRVSAVSIESCAWLSFCFTITKTWAYLLNSVFTDPKVSHTSLDLFWMARVRKPICRAFNKAAIVLGPDNITLYSRWIASAKLGRRITSA